MKEKREKNSKADFEKKVKENNDLEIFENESDLEKLAEKNISEMEKKKNDLDLGRSEEDLKKSIEAIGLDNQIKEEVLRDHGTTEKLGEVSKKADTFFENAKNKIRKAIALGMATMAFSGPGCFANRANSEKNNFQEIGVQMENEASREELRKAWFEEGRNIVKKHIESQEYLKKLEIELGGNSEKAKIIQNQRLDFLKSCEVEFVDEDDLKKYFLESTLIGRVIYIPQWFQKMIYSHNGLEEVGGLYDHNKHKIYLLKNPESTHATHELLHSSLKAFEITENAKKLLEDSYKNLGNYKDKYLKKIEERIVMKQQLDLEMDYLGIKKYGEKFTKKHFDGLMEHAYMGNLSEPSMNFLETTKLEYLEKIFNEIALEDNVKKNIEQA